MSLEFKSIVGCSNKEKHQVAEYIWGLDPLIYEGISKHEMVNALASALSEPDTDIGAGRLIIYNEAPIGFVSTYDQSERSERNMRSLLCFLRHMSKNTRSALKANMKRLKKNIAALDFEDSTYLEKIFFFQGVSGKGFGRCVFMKLVSESGGILSFHVWENNSRAIKFYQKLGAFVETKNRSLTGDKYLQGYFING